MINYHFIQDAESGSMITTIQATDPDFQLNGIVNYYFQNLTLSQGPFQINRETGAITLRSGDDGALDRERVDFYEVKCYAYKNLVYSYMEEEYFPEFSNVVIHPVCDYVQLSYDLSIYTFNFCECPIVYSYHERHLEFVHCVGGRHSVDCSLVSAADCDSG